MCRAYHYPTNMKLSFNTQGKSLNGGKSSQIIGRSYNHEFLTIEPVYLCSYHPLTLLTSSIAFTTSISPVSVSLRSVSAA